VRTIIVQERQGEGRAAAFEHVMLTGRVSQSTAIDWPEKVSAAVQNRYLNRVEETPASAADVLESAESFCEGGALSIDVERTLFEAFVEDDYDGRLHLTTLRNESDAVVGLVFWREVPEDEMKSWINFDALSASVSDLRGMVNDVNAEIVDDDSIHRQRHRSSLVPVREESLHWLYQASTSRRDLVSQPRGKALSREEVIEDLTHRWVKIELLAVRKPFWGNKYGSLLLACALCEAYSLNNNRAILHVAGGYSNVPAVKLYQRFGFVGVPAGDGGMFNKPDRDLFVLGNIGTALQSLSWTDVLTLPDDRPSIEGAKHTSRSDKEESDSIS